MKDGFIKIAAASLPTEVANCGFQAQQCIAAIRRAVREHVQILVLPELCLTGYTCHDLFTQDALRRSAWQALEQVAAQTGPVLVFVGLPVAVKGKLYNCAAVLFDGAILALIPKTQIPAYGEFYESRHFYPGPQQGFYLPGTDIWFGPALFQAAGCPECLVGCEICEDLWAPKQPSQELCMAGATVIVNLSASPAAVGKGEYRRALVQGQSARLVCGYAFACAGCQESTQDLVFSGHNMICENGAVLAESHTMEPDWISTELDVFRLSAERIRQTTYGASPAQIHTISFRLPEMETTLTRFVDPHPFVPAEQGHRHSRCEQILNIQSTGLARRLRHTGAKTAVVGLSGGLDSTLALLVMARAADSLGWDRSRLLAVTMPCYGTTGRTRSNAENMARCLGVSFREIPIGQAVAQHFRDIGLPDSDRSTTYENAQARERTQVLMDLANRENGLVVGTGDLSELALGWATYNGDHMSMYGVNAGVPKTLVRHIVRYVAGICAPELSRVLLDILDTPVSPELLPPAEGEISQRTEELVGPYELHDFFLYQIVRCGFAPRKVFRLALRAFDGVYEPEVILKWLKNFYRRFFQQQFKRSCLPDGPKVGSVSLSPRGDWRMPSDAQAAIWLAQLEEIPLP